MMKITWTTPVDEKIQFKDLNAGDCFTFCGTPNTLMMRVAYDRGPFWYLDFTNGCCYSVAGLEYVVKRDVELHVSGSVRWH